MQCLQCRDDFLQHFSDPLLIGRTVWTRPREIVVGAHCKLLDKFAEMGIGEKHGEGEQACARGFEDDGRVEHREEERASVRGLWRIERVSA